MRVLVATTAGNGHFGPIVPFALACVGAGHEAPTLLGAAMARAGLEHLPLASTSEAEVPQSSLRCPDCLSRNRTRSWCATGSPVPMPDQPFKAWLLSSETGDLSNHA